VCCVCWLQSGHLPMPHFGPYSASKHALEGLNDCMAYELAPQGIDVLLVNLGPARTPIWQSLGTPQERLAQVVTSPDMAQLYEADFAAVRVGDLLSVVPAASDVQCTSACSRTSALTALLQPLCRVGVRNRCKLRAIMECAHPVMHGAACICMSASNNIASYFSIDTARTCTRPCTRPAACTAYAQWAGSLAQRCCCCCCVQMLREAE
jgi:hypothetical protein